MSFCMNCGTKLPDNARFCPQCGTPVVQRAPQTSTPQVSQPAQQPIHQAPQSTPQPTQQAPQTSPVGTQEAFYSGAYNVSQTIQNTPVSTMQEGFARVAEGLQSGQSGMQQMQQQQQMQQTQPLHSNTVPASDLSPYDPRFSAIPVRYRCSGGHVYDGTESDVTCRKCGAYLQKGGIIQLYRMGNMMGMAVGMGIYIDDVPMGHIANKQSIRINLPLGQHKVHVTHTATRKCNDPIITIVPGKPTAYCKAYFTSAGFAIGVEEVTANDMPQR